MPQIRHCQLQSIIQGPQNVTRGVYTFFFMTPDAGEAKLTFPSVSFCGKSKQEPRSRLMNQYAQYWNVMFFISMSYNQTSDFDINVPYLSHKCCLCFTTQMCEFLPMSNADARIMSIFLNCILIYCPITLKFINPVQGHAPTVFSTVPVLEN